MKNRFLAVISAIVLLGSCNSTKTEETKIPILTKEDTAFVFKYGGQKFLVDPDGGRIITHEIDGRSIIGPNGSTLWTSPQSQWGWPPIAEHDQLPYSSEMKGDTLILKSKKDTTLGVEITKIIFANTAENTFIVKYGIVNKNDSTIKIAPWENTRTFKTALMVFPAGTSDSTASNEAFGNLKLTTSNGVKWYQYDSLRITGKGKIRGKLFADGSEGWIAAVFNDLILIKKFKDLSPAETAPGEGEIEIYSDFEHSFSEMEQQGPYTELKPNETLWWEVKWILRNLPEGVEAKEGSEALLKAIRAEIK